MEEKESLIQFPCDFQIKIIGKNQPSFEHEVIVIIRKHFPNITEGAIRLNPSQNSNYLAISVIVHAENKEALDALYTELSKHPEVQMVL